MLGCPIRMCDGKTVFYGILGSSIIFRIVDLLIHNGLKLGILCGINFKSSRIKKISRLAFRISKLPHKSGNDLFDQLIGKITEMGVCFLCGCIYVLDPLIHIVCQRLFQLLFVDIILIIHILKDNAAAFGISLGAGDRIETGGIFRDGGENRTFGKGKIRYFFIKIPPCGHLYTQSIIAQVNGVEIIGNNDFFCFFLGHAGIFFQMYGKILLLELSFNTGSPAGFHTAGKDIVFDKLLCDGASATGIVVAD